MPTLKNLTWMMAVAAMGLLGASVPTPAHRFTPQQSPSSTSTMTRTATHRMSDTAFAKKAAEANLAEVKLGKLAEEKGGTTTVKDFGKRMVHDHTQADDQLKQVAQKQNITLPDTLDVRDRATYNKLSKLSGAAFDRACARDMVTNHEKDVAAFKKEANTGANEAIKNFASETVPTLEEHLKLAHQMMDSVSGASGGQSGSSR